MIQFGNDKIGEIYVGSDKIKEVYYGSDLVWSGFKPSYLILTNNNRIDFDLDNTPLSNLSTTGGATSSITVNGQSVVKDTIKEIYFGDRYNAVTSIGDYFLYYCSNLTSIDLSGLSNVTSIGAYFFHYCYNLISIDFGPLSNVTSIEHSFLSTYSRLTSIDLSPLSNVTSIGDYFLYNCSFLATLIMGAETPPTLGSSAFYSTNKLSLIQVPCASESAYKSATNWNAKASIIKGDCPPSVIKLTDNTLILFDLDNTPLSNLSTTGGATSSITVNGQSVVKDTIKEIYFGDRYNAVTSIGDSFLRNCSSLTSLDLRGLRNVTSIGLFFLYNCSSLPYIDLSPLSNVTTVVGGFLYDCSSLTSIDLSGLSNVTSIENYFLYNCSSLPTIDLSGLSNVTSIGSTFLYHCSSLTSLDLSALSNVTSIDSGFLYCCSNLTQFKMGAVNVPQTPSIGFLQNTTAITTILVPMQSVQAYKTKSPWSNHASKIIGY